MGNTFTNLRFEVTTKCNFKCSHCHVSANKKGSDLEYDDFLHLLDSPFNSSLKKIRFSGGEPSLWPHLIMAIQECIKRNLIVSINTVNPSLIKYLGKVFYKNDKILITTTLNSYYSLEHDRIVGEKGHFQNLLESVDKVHKSLNIDINFPLTRNNIKTVFKTRNLLENYGVNKICLNRLYASGRAKNKKYIFPDKSELSNLILQVINDFKCNDRSTKIKFTNGIPLCIVPQPKDFLDFNDGPLCKYGRESLNISSDGKPYVCVAFPWWDKHIKKNKPICFYQSETLQKWRNNMFLPMECRICHYVSDCRGGCRLAALEASSNIDGHDPLSIFSKNKR